MQLKKVFTLALAALMLLSLWACGKQEDTYQSGTDAVVSQTKLMSDEAGKLTIYCESELQLIYDEAGKVIAVLPLSETAKDIASSYEFAEKDCASAVLELIDQLLDQDLLLSKAFILIRQEPGSATPGDDFIKTLQENAQQNKGSYPVIVAAADELDQDGLFSADIALAVLKVSYPAVEGLTLDCAEAPVGGSYTVTCTDADGNVTAYSIGAIDGTVSVLENQEQNEPEDATIPDPIPESDIFDPIPDTEAIQGADGGVDNGSVDFG